jgi:hypothetical protein
LVNLEAKTGRRKIINMRVRHLGWGHAQAGKPVEKPNSSTFSGEKAECVEG